MAFPRFLFLVLIDDEDGYNSIIDHPPRTSGSKGTLSTEITAQAMIFKVAGVFDYRTCLLVSQSLTGSQTLMEYSKNSFTKGPSG